MPDAFVHHLFGVIDVTEDDYWDADVEFGNRRVEVDLNTDLGEISDKAMRRVDWFLNNLKQVDQEARAAIRVEYEHEEGEARCYQSHHLIEINDDAFAKFVGRQKPASDDFEGFLALCYMTRLGLYVENEEQFAIADYTIGVDMTDYLLSVVFDAKCVARSVAMES